jgi:hypothetical protein
MGERRVVCLCIVADALIGYASAVSLLDSSSPAPAASGPAERVAGKKFEVATGEKFRVAIASRISPATTQQ